MKGILACVVLFSACGLSFCCEENGYDKCRNNGECCSGYCDKATEHRYGLCQPACGRSFSNSPRPKTSPSRPAKYGEFPWYAGIYQYNSTSGQYDQICGGTLISKRVIISAAQCVTTEGENSRKIGVKDLSVLKVAVGKHYRTLNAVEDRMEQIFDVEKIEVPPQYLGPIALYDYDIVFITLESEVEYNSAVTPACLDIGGDDFEKDQLKKGVMGKVVGWGITPQQTISDGLMLAEMPYAPKDECISQIGNAYYVSGDKICAGDKSSNVGVCKGDSGGGLIFEDLETKAYYLRGIVSLGPIDCHEGGLVLFTKLSIHKDLVRKYLGDCKGGCKQICGKSSRILSELIRQPEYVKFPWHAGIYQYNVTTSSYDHICGGTLISKKFVISAAQCVVTEDENTSKISIKDLSMLKVAIGKNYRPYNAYKDSMAQIVDVIKIEISPEYTGRISLWAYDFAIITLETEIEYTRAARPACLDLGDNNFEMDQLKKGNLGKVVAWEMPPQQVDNKTLKIVEVPFVPKDECLSKMNDDSTDYVSGDKICGGDKSSDSSVCRCDGGGGLVFEDTETKAYYLRGVVSLVHKGCKGVGHALFTRLSSHRGLVEKYLNNCDNGGCKNSQCPPLRSEKLLTICYDPNGRSTRCDQPLPNNSRATFICNPLNYMKAREPDFSEIHCRNGHWDRPLVDDFCQTACGRAVSLAYKPLVSNGKQTTYGEFPWHAGIYQYNASSGLYDQICGGTLISHKVIVSAAHCVTVEDTKIRKLDIIDLSLIKVAVGKYYRTLNASEDALSQVFDIEGIEVPSQYVGPIGLYDYDIAFITVESEIDYTWTVGPVCLDFSDYNFEEDQLQRGAIGKVVGWGSTIDTEASETLILAEMPFVPRFECISKIATTLILPASRDRVICAGNQTSSVGVCQGDSGGGLVFQEPKSKAYYLRGIVSLGPRGCKGEEYALFTKVSSYKEILKKYIKLT